MNHCWNLCSESFAFPLSNINIIYCFCSMMQVTIFNFQSNEVGWQSINYFETRSSVLNSNSCSVSTMWLLVHTIHMFFMPSVIVLKIENWEISNLKWSYIILILQYYIFVVKIDSILFLDLLFLVTHQYKNMDYICLSIYLRRPSN